MAGFERSITKVFNETLKSSRITKASDPDVIKDDVLEGLTSVVTVRMSEPQFEGQTKEILGTAAATKIVAAVISKELTRYFSARGSKVQSRLILEKVAGAAKTRVSVRAHKDVQRRKMRWNHLHFQPNSQIVVPMKLNILNYLSLRATQHSVPQNQHVTLSSKLCYQSAARF